MGSILLDSSVAIAVLDDTDLHHEKASAAFVEAIRSDAQLRISAVSVAELASDSRPGRRARIANLRAFVDMLGDESVVQLDRATALRAGELRASRRSIGLADALIKATAEAISADELLTTDRALARLDGARYVGASRR